MILAKKAKRFCSLLLTVIIIAGFTVPAVVMSVVAEEITVTADGMNTARGTGQLIIFTSDFGASTGTNEWGFEVTVSKDNIVTKVGGNDSAIPSGGFVLSGHDEDEGIKMKTFLMNNVKVGDYVVYSNTSLIITISDKPISGSSYYKKTQSFNALNKTRSTDHLIVFNTIGTKTGTNEWGYEVVCESGIVVALGGNDSYIPNKEGSFVLSGHGAMAEWLKLNVKLGMEVSYDGVNLTITLDYNAEAAARGINYALVSIESDYAEALEKYSYIDFSSIRSKLDLATDTFGAAYTAFKSGGNAAEYESACANTEALIEEIRYLFAESRTVEYRGVWIRPSQKTTAAVEEYVQRLYDAGINLICIETLYSGTMIMPMPKGSLFEQNPGWRGFDMLQAFIDACHSRDMELHIWMPIFYVGHPGSENSAMSVGTKKPEWLAVHNKGGTLTPAEDGVQYQFLNPANPEAMNYLLETYKYILENYNIDGFQLDYIRYFRRNANFDYGYDDITLGAFEEKYGVRPAYNTSASYWKDWVAFRAQYVTDMVIAVRELIDEVRPSVLLSADVAPNIDEAFNYVYQDYMRWLDEGYLDLLHPMSYGDGFDKEIAEQVVRCGDSVFIAVGLGIFMPELFAWDMLRQVKNVNSMGADGAVYFEAGSYLAKGTGTVLTSSIYKNRAITPTLDKAAALIASLEYAIGRIDDILLPLEGINEAEADSLKAAINAIITAANAGESIIETFDTAEDAIGALTNVNAKAAVARDLAYARKISAIGSRVPDRIDVSKDESEESEISDGSSVPSDENSTETEKTFPIVPVAIAAFIAVAAVAAILLVGKKNKK